MQRKAEEWPVQYMNRNKNLLKKLKVKTCVVVWSESLVRERQF